MELIKAFFIAASGMRAESERIRVVSENVANAGSTAITPGSEPYRRKIVSFASQFDRAIGANRVHVLPVRRDMSAFGKRFDPHHPAADADGYVLLPNVNGTIEMIDLREAQRSYEANLAVMEMTKDLAARTLEILRA